LAFLLSEKTIQKHSFRSLFTFNIGISKIEGQNELKMYTISAFNDSLLLIRPLDGKENNFKTYLNIFFIQI